MAEDNSKLQQLQEAILSGNIPQMVLSTISYALDVRSSDIHIEPEENTVRIRYRVDGVLRQVVEFPHNIHPAVVSRIKIMSNLKIDEQRMPQDGRSTVTTKDGREMDLRISTLPTVKGEKVVMRIQDKSREIPDLPELGLQGASLAFMEDALSLPNGIILTTGPTGSGKTTTMYSALTRLNKVDVNIMTIEDPVEIQLDGLNQSQVHPDIDYTFANGLRTALRQDPDIIMVGEIRDRETIDIAIESSLTGHLVFSTIHTNSAVETLTRILNMGVPPFLLASSIELIIAQRLVRKLCPACKIPAQPDPEILKLAKKALSMIQSQDEIEPEKLQEMNFYGPKGCEECDNIGFKGRVGLYEVMRMSNELRRMILSSANTLDIEKAAMNTGMVTLEQVGIIKALKGETSLDEVYRVAKRMELEAPEEEEEQSEAPAPQQKEAPPTPSKESQKEGKKLIAKVQTMPAPGANKTPTVQKAPAPQKEAEPVSKEQPPVVQESPPAPQKADPAPSEQQKPVPMESPNPQQ